MKHTGTNTNNSILYSAVSQSCNKNKNIKYCWKFPEIKSRNLPSDSWNINGSGLTQPLSPDWVWVLIIDLWSELRQECCNVINTILWLKILFFVVLNIIRSHTELETVVGLRKSKTGRLSPGRPFIAFSPQEWDFTLHTRPGLAWAAIQTWGYKVHWAGLAGRSHLAEWKEGSQ